MKKSMKLRTRFIITFSIIILFYTFILSSIIGLDFSTVYRQERGDALAQKALQMTNILERYMWARTGEINVLSKLDIFKDTSNTEEVRKVLDELKRNFSPYTWVGFIDSKEVVLEATDGMLKGRDLSAEPIYHQALNNTYIGEVHEVILLDEELHEPTNKKMKYIDISTPIFSDDGKFVGVLASYLDWEWIGEAEKTMYQSVHSERSTEIFIIRKSDNIVLFGPKDLVGTNIDMESIDKVKKGEMGWTVETWADGKPYFTAYVLESEFSKYRCAEWIVLAREPLISVYGYLKEATLFSIKVAISSIVLFIIIGLISANRITNPLKQLTNVANKLREGEVIEIPKIKGVREIEILASSLDNLIKSLSTTKVKLGEMKGLANHDKLTQLFNRTALETYLNSLEDLTFIILYMDLDGFKLVNDTYGHHVGDLLLQEVANRIKASIASDELDARMGGNEFVVVINTSTEDFRSRGFLVANKIIEELTKPFIIEKQQIRVGCSVGGAIWKIDSRNIIELTHMADQTLYKSKANGKGIFTYYSKE